ncbi:Nitrogenase molybdenum-iron protein alpha chain [Dissostichus eleginoides]|uniref:Nitrogenase molybdenum-iron protein alpha chain n=1 Tax=Dissostichus eleginoides TaxID=100907 RepID=A0AAD9B4V5_DISEL|nr:Nitrogenase molybdenum-iron protein alpha chain [Dissostichus eleginoides]KAK1876706.1 Nitrogenase molybdenum-iron protein alpha chain [Dissostichus eleginoides]
MVIGRFERRLCVTKGLLGFLLEVCIYGHRENKSVKRKPFSKRNPGADEVKKDNPPRINVSQFWTPSTLSKAEDLGFKPEALGFYFRHLQHDEGRQLVPISPGISGNISRKLSR